MKTISEESFDKKISQQQYDTLKRTSYSQNTRYSELIINDLYKVSFVLSNYDYNTRQELYRVVNFYGKLICAVSGADYQSPNDFHNVMLVFENMFKGPNYIFFNAQFNPCILPDSVTIDYNFDPEYDPKYKFENIFVRKLYDEETVPYYTEQYKLLLEHINSEDITGLISDYVYDTASSENTVKGAMQHKKMHFKKSSDLSNIVSLKKIEIKELILFNKMMTTLLSYYIYNDNKFKPSDEFLSKLYILFIRHLKYMFGNNRQQIENYSTNFKIVCTKLLTGPANHQGVHIKPVKQTSLTIEEMEPDVQLKKYLKYKNKYMRLKNL